MTAYDPYAHAVDRFEALCNSVISDRAETPRQLVLNAGIPKSSGYRALNALEKNGFLSRDSKGDYLRGDVAWQVGLAAWGFGRGLNAVLPLVRYLRAQTRRTACLCVVNEGRFHIGPFSLAQGRGHIRPPSASMSFWAEPEAPDLLELESSAGRLSAIWAPTTSSKAACVAGFAILTRDVPPARRIAFVTHVRAVAQMARAARALEESHR